MTREERFQKISKELGYSFDGEVKVGVFQLPKNASVEVDFVVAVD